MASRSTRRRLKNTDIPKLDECENEEETNDAKQSPIGKRRSLRHSPGSSYASPPRKSRKIKDSPNLTEKLIYSASKNSVSSQLPTSPEESQRDDSIEEAESVNITPIRSSRNKPIVLGLSPDTTTMKNTSSIDSPKLPNKLHSDNVAGTSKINKHRKNSPIKESGHEPSLTSKNPGLDCSSNTSLLEKSLHISTSEASQCISTSQDTQGENANGTEHATTRHTKRKCHSPEVETPVAANGKISVGDLCYFKEKKLKLGEMVETNPSTTPTNSSSSGANSLTDTSTHSNGKCLEKDTGTSTKEYSVPCKRKLAESPEIVEAKKRSRGDDGNLSLELSNSSECVGEKSLGLPSSSCIASTDGLSKQNTYLADISNVDTLSNSEIILTKDFELTESQCKEICNVLPSELRDSENIVEIVEELVRKLLMETSVISSMSSPRFNKFLRQLLFKYCNSDAAVERKHNLCESAHEWSKERKSTNLRHELELALMTLYYDTGFHRKAEETATGLYKETKKLQDKEKTVKACLCLSKAYHAMGNISKARANITTAKTEALKIYTPPDLQAELDLQSGIMQVAEEKDMETAFSYFKEAATGFTCKSNRSRALKYMLLTKLLVNRPEEGEKAVRSQSHVEDIDTGVEAMLCITKAAVSASLSDFKKAREQYVKELEDDLVVRGVLDQLYGKMLEKNLLNIISPYERMQISVVSEKIGLERKEVERRLSQLILDGEISAQLDHRDDCLYVYKAEDKDTVYQHSLDTVTQLDKTLSHLNRRVKQLL